jgi:hypothetical protein
MQKPTDQAGAEASTQKETTVTSTVVVRRKAAKRTCPLDLAEGDLHLVPSSPHAEDLPARKKPRIEDPLPATTKEAARKTASPDVSVGLSSPPTAAVATNANANLATDMQPNAGATRRHWTLEEDAKLTSAVPNTSKKKWGTEYMTNWDAVAMLVPGRTSSQCMRRWKNFLDPNIDRGSGRTGKWTIDEDKKS